MRVPHNRPLILDSDRASISEVLDSGWIAEGPKVAALEASFVAAHKGGSACAVSSGTAALFLALKGLGVGEGNAVAVPSYSCSALLNAVNMAGARAIPVDVCADDFTISADSTRQLAPHAHAVIAVHTFGASAGVADFMADGAFVVEDCCQSLGGPQGHDGHVAVYSFYATKVLTGGQGGLLWDKSGAVAERTRDYREFDGLQSYVPRFNLQMTDIQGAMILSQFGRLDWIRTRRQAIRSLYVRSCQRLFSRGWRTQAGLNTETHLPYRFALVAPAGEARNDLKSHLDRLGVTAIVPVERHELLHNYMEIDPHNYPVSEMLAECALSIPLYPALSDAEVEAVCNALQCAA